MTIFRITFEKIDDVTPEHMQTGKIRTGYKYCSTHMVFDIKMDKNLKSKARLVANGHKMDALFSTTYSSVVSRASVGIAFLIA